VIIDDKCLKNYKSYLYTRSSCTLIKNENKFIWLLRNGRTQKCMHHLLRSRCSCVVKYNTQCITLLLFTVSETLKCLLSVLTLLIFCLLLFLHLSDPWLQSPIATAQQKKMMKTLFWVEEDLRQNAVHFVMPSGY